MKIYVYEDAGMVTIDDYVVLVGTTGEPVLEKRVVPMGERDKLVYQTPNTFKVRNNSTQKVYQVYRSDNGHVAAIAFTGREAKEIADLLNEKKG